MKTTPPSPPTLPMQVRAQRKQLFKSVAHCKAAGPHVKSQKSVRQKARQALKAEWSAGCP